MPAVQTLSTAPLPLVGEEYTAWASYQLLCFDSCWIASNKTSGWNTVELVITSGQQLILTALSRVDRRPMSSQYSSQLCLYYDMLRRMHSSPNFNSISTADLKSKIHSSLQEEEKAVRITSGECYIVKRSRIIILDIPQIHRCSDLILGTSSPGKISAHVLHSTKEIANGDRVPQQYVRVPLFHGCIDRRVSFTGAEYAVFSH